MNFIEYFHLPPVRKILIIRFGKVIVRLASAVLPEVCVCFVVMSVFA